MLEGIMESLAKEIENLSIGIHNRVFPQGDESSVSEDELQCADKATPPSESQAGISSLPSPMDVYKKIPPPQTHTEPVKPAPTVPVAPVKPSSKGPDPIEVRYKPNGSITYVYEAQAKNKIEEEENKIISSSLQKPPKR